MAPIVHIMRHGQGYHSSAVTENGYLLRDPHLTETGKDQCRERCRQFARHDKMNDNKIELLLASPLRRALQTCQLSFAPCIARGLQIMAIPHAEEVSDAPSDTGSPVDVLKKEFGDGVDFSMCEGDWFKHEGDFAINPSAVNRRAVKLRKFIKARPETEIALVSHGFFNHFLTGEVDDNGEQTTPWWNETELRTYTFVDGDDETAMIVETRESFEGRGGSSHAKASEAVMNDPARRGSSSPDGSEEARAAAGPAKAEDVA